MKILLVEDHDALRHNIEAVLKSEGYTVVSCADGIDAEFQIVNNSSDLILLDRMLPGQDGLTITRKARAQGITTPILMLTALDSLGDKVSGLDAGADDYIVKPFAMEELLARLRIWSRRSVPWKIQVNWILAIFATSQEFGCSKGRKERKSCRSGWHS